MKENRNKVILIESLNGVLSLEDIKELEEYVEMDDIQIQVHSYSPRYMNAFEDLYAQIEIICSQDVLFALFTGVVGSGIYDVIKTFLCKIYSKMKGRHVTKIQAKKLEEVPINIHFIIGGIKVVLPLDIDDEKYKYFVDKMYESIRDETVTKKEFCVWNKETGEVEYYSESEIVRKTYLNSTKKGP